LRMLPVFGSKTRLPVLLWASWSRVEQFAQHAAGRAPAGQMK
jgi:hypothetical protein